MEWHRRCQWTCLDSSWRKSSHSLSYPISKQQAKNPSYRAAGRCDEGKCWYCIFLDKKSPRFHQHHRHPPSIADNSIKNKISWRHFLAHPLPGRIYQKRRSFSRSHHRDHSGFPTSQNTSKGTSSHDWIDHFEWQGVASGWYQIKMHCCYLRRHKTVLFYFM